MNQHLILLRWRVKIHSEGESIQQQQPLEPEVTTDDVFSENVSELNSPSDITGGNSYYQIPKLNYDDIVVPNSEIHELIGRILENLCN